jgi:NADPH-dependent 2,4-dienoyl-CoA reductase/sulfur reductase-like enzyme
VEIDRSKKQIRIQDRVTGEEVIESYDKLILSPGANPTKPPLPGVDSKKVFTLRDLPDSDSIKNCLERNKAESAVIVGGGSIGMESVENFSRQGVAVTVVEKGNQLMPPLDYDMAVLLHQHLRDQDIALFLDDSVESFQDKEGRLVVSTGKGLRLETDLALLAIGVRPEKELAEKAGLTIGERGGIHVDELRDRLDELDRNKTYIAYCTVSLRGYIAYRILVQTGFKAKILSGGWDTWSPIQEDRLERAS